MREVRLFISHSWADRDQYEDLLRLLRSIADLKWHNLSVSGDSPLTTSLHGAPAQDQELLLQQRRLASVEQRLRSVSETCYRLEQRWRKAEADRIERAVPYQEALGLSQKLIDAKESPFSQYMLKLLTEQTGLSVEAIEDKLKVLDHMSEESPIPVPDDLTSMREQRERLEREKQFCAERIRRIRANNGLGLYLPRYDGRDILYSAGKMNEDAIQQDRNLVLMLREQIASSDVVLLIAEMYAQYRLWMECEFALALEEARPIVAVLPRGQAECPREVRFRATAIVDWDKVALGSALFNFGLDCSARSDNHSQRLF